MDSTKVTENIRGRNRFIFSLIVVGVAIALIVVGLVWYNRYQYQRSLITYTNPDLTQQETSVFQNEINDLQGKVQNSSKEDQYRDYLKIGADYAAIGELSKARDAYTSASNLFQDIAVPWGEMARTSLKMKDYEKAKTYIEKALALNPTNSDFKDLQKQVNTALSQ